MKYLISFILVLVSFSAIAQKQIEKTIGEFSELKAYDLIELELIKSDVDKVVITGKNKNEA